MWGQELSTPARAGAQRWASTMRAQAELNDAVDAFLEHGTTGNLERMRAAHTALLDRSST